MARGPWQIAPVDEARATRFGRELELPPPVARIVARRFEDLDGARAFLAPQLADLVPPAEMAGLARAVERVGGAVVAGEQIGVFGDYDVDGVSSTALVADYLERLGEVQPVLRVARRDEGYGFHASQARELLDSGCRLVLLVDCGTSDLEAVSILADEGVDVVALDHHRVSADGPRWPGYELINPQRPDCGFPEKGLCSVGLAFYFVAALRRQLERHSERRGRAAPDPRLTLDLVALGTIADVAPLTGVNRILVRKGLEQLGRTQRPGLRELLQIADLTGRRPRSDDVAWRLAPRLNAPGRLGDAALALGCLHNADGEAARGNARRCNALNEERKAIQQRIFDEALEQASQRSDDGFCLVASEGWHPGVNGIVASKLAETFGRPAAVVSWEGSRGRASARSVPGIDLFALLSACGEHMQRYGGHAGAAGFSLAPEQLEPLRAALCRVTAPQLDGLVARPLELAAEVTLAEVDSELCRQLARLEPFGEGNRQPVFSAAGVRVESARIVGRDHVRLALKQGQAVRSAIGFRFADRNLEAGDTIDAAFVPEIDDYHGPRLQLRLVDVRPAGRSAADRGGGPEDGEQDDRR